MQSVKYRSIDFYVCYECPACHWDHWLNKSQLETFEYVVECSCGMSFKPIGTQTHTEKTESNEVTETTTNNNLREAIEILTDQGFDLDQLIGRSANIDGTASINVIMQELIA